MENCEFENCRICILNDNMKIVVFGHREINTVVFDSIPMQVNCCGIGPNGYLDWSANEYFACESDNPSVESCGVPYTCCREPDNMEVGGI